MSSTAEAAGAAHHGSGAYIQHHLQNLQVCKGEHGEWIWNDCAGNFWAVNVDSMFFSILLGAVFIAIFWSAARKNLCCCPNQVSGVCGDYCRLR